MREDVCLAAEQGRCGLGPRDGRVRLRSQIRDQLLVRRRIVERLDPSREPPPPAAHEPREDCGGGEVEPAAAWRARWRPKSGGRGARGSALPGVSRGAWHGPLRARSLERSDDDRRAPAINLRQLGGVSVIRSSITSPSRTTPHRREASPAVAQRGSRLLLEKRPECSKVPSAGVVSRRAPGGRPWGWCRAASRCRRWVRRTTDAAIARLTTSPAVAPEASRGTRTSRGWDARGPTARA